ncbi:MAG: peptidoglycan editing factor PgeF [Candidatus Aminicenantes bacterium]|nr:peptidoglycan editing factor PgeF [Candidatus Aminicenantes bacterium]
MKDRALRSAVITIPRLERVPFLKHGFGNRHWRDRDFKRSGDWDGFHPVFLKQIHSDIVHFIDGMPQPGLRGDALVTRLPGLLLVIKTADCLPVLLVDEKKRVVAAVHCGWKGTRLRVLEKTVKSMSDRYSVDPATILAALGPCIGAGCYEVGEDVLNLYAEAAFPASLLRPAPGRPGKHLLDLRAAARLQLSGLGVKEKNIFSIDVCTHCDPDYPSYRRDGKGCGRLLSFIGIIPV